MPLFRVGQKVKIRSDADSAFAGCTGVTVFVQDTVCDVRLTYHQPNSEVPETVIEMVPVSDLEQVQRSPRHISVVD